jgi:ATP-dependent DNA helicase PIF1
MDDINQEIIDSIENKENIIFHGPGGCGKSYSIKFIANFFQSRGKKVYCTATTGVAAINLCDSEKKITATTLHSWAGVGTAKLSAKKLFFKVAHSKARERWEETELLIIDEVSMLGAEFMDKLDYIGQNIKHCDKPFGGIQLLLSGDFLQLPPVKDEWVFNSRVWDKFNLHPFIFEEPKRYDDRDYFNFLLRIRNGSHTPEDEKKIRARIKAYTKFLEIVKSNKDNINIVKPTFIYSKKKDVNQENEIELDKLEGEAIEFIAEDSFTPYNNKARYDYYIELLDDSIPKAIALKKGAQVMLKFNLDTKGGLVNGTRGVVLNIESGRVTVRFINGKKLIIEKIPWEVEDKDGCAVRHQIPLLLAWACTVHKCVSGDTTIFTDKGMFKIKDIITKEGWNNKKINVYTRRGLERTSKTFMGGEEDSIKITTRMGYKLEGSVRHPILVRTQEGKHIWKKMPDLKIGDIAIIKCNLQCGSLDNLSTEEFVPEKDNHIPIIPKYITDELCYVMGLLVGDGCYSGKKFQIEFGKRNEQIIETYRKLIKDLFNYDCKFYDYSSKRVPRLCIFSKNIRLFFKWCGLDFVTAPNKKIPWSVLNNTISAQKSFIRGLFDTDGGVNNDGIHLTSVSLTLMEQMHILLLNLGVISKLGIIREAVGKWSTTYRIYISGEGAVNYAKYIGFHCERKNKLLDKFRVSSKFVPKSNIGFFPDSKIVARQIQASYKLSKKNGVSSLISSCANERSTLTTRHIPYLNERLDLPSTKVGRMLFKIYNKGYFFDPITAIEKNKCIMYDFEVPGSHSFITNGIVSHNCQSTTLDYAVCDLGTNIFCEGQAYVALSRVRNLHGLFITDFYPPSIKVNKQALEYSKKLEELSKKYIVKDEEDNSEDTDFVIDITE